LRKYSVAARWNDPEVAKDALYDVIIENPGNDSLIFTLAYFYYDQEKYASSYLISNDLLQRSPKNPSYLEMAATSAQQLGVNDKALLNYESLYLINNNVKTLYQIAFLQYQLKRFAEATNSINMLIARPEVATEKVVFNDAKGNPKEYSMKVSILNLKGLVALDQNDKPGAKKAFTDALALAPDFVPAKENMQKTN
jgi:predicted Zn-dependent protease